ncbi:Dolichyl-phosphate beta-glucosyltransferase [Orchesella cincta]|uniref:Dolichyl-phosphate beta-glucosyltransferase n=1 Tax=Orchesella cincta TaxID=48709 RepID=A0A1D2N2L8_ORCCI|nr:Dolichyl-phosphate beta-glucosyltransferase [Orchesella cincta]
MEIDILLAFILLMITGILILFLVCIMLLKDVQPYPNWKRYDTEKYLRIQIPELNALTAMMEDCLPYLERRLENERTFSYEIVIVNDGSKDSTADVAMGVSFSSRGEYILFADADGATRFSDIDKIFTSIKGLTDKAKSTYGVTKWRVPCIVCGSRLYEEDQLRHIFFRTVLMYAFHFLVWLFTPCVEFGIHSVVSKCSLVPQPESSSITFILSGLDVELLYIAQKLKMPIDEVAVYWTEIEGRGILKNSKVTPILSWIQMGMDLFAIWLRYTTGRWRLANKGD